MFLTHHEVLEELEKNTVSDKKQIDLDEIRVLYSDSEYSIGDKEYTPKELHEAKLRLLENLRRSHC